MSQSGELSGESPSWKGASISLSPTEPPKHFILRMPVEKFCFSMADYLLGRRAVGGLRPPRVQPNLKVLKSEIGRYSAQVLSTTALRLANGCHVNTQHMTREHSNFACMHGYTPNF